jgi:hypothetical protein
MPLTTKVFPLDGGIDRSVISSRAPVGSFYDLLNFRQKKMVLGEVEQTPHFYEYTTITRGTYWNGASTTEPSTSAVKYWDPYLTITEFCVSNTFGAQMQVFYQTSAPATETVNTGCLLVINNIAALAVTLGNTLQVEIDSATTFRWRKNGGGWTAGLACSVSGTSIDGGNATVYFLAASGFTIADSWIWQRTDCGYETLANFHGAPTRMRTYKNLTYFTSQDDRLMVVKTAGSTKYVISVGYRPVFTTFFTFYEDHLICGGYATAATSSAVVPYYNGTRSRTVGWSDVTDIENLIPTDLNEADQYVLPLHSAYVDNTYSPIVGVAVLAQQLFVFTARGTYYTPYFGLPLVFSFNEYNAQLLTYHPYNNVTEGDRVVFLLTPQDVLIFNGSDVQSVALPLAAITGATAQNRFGVYNFKTEEFCVFCETGTNLFVFPLSNRRWYRRKMGFTNNVNSINIGPEGYITPGNSSLQVLKEDVTWLSTPVFDNSGAFVVPTITLQVFTDGMLSSVKEITGLYLGCVVTTVDGTAYSTGANCQVKVYWYDCPSGTIQSAAVTDTNAVYVNTNVDGLIPLPRVAFRGLALELRLNGLTAGEPPGQVVVTGLEGMFTGLQSENVQR